MDSTMSVVMKGVSDALRLDGCNKLQEAYIKYLECVLRVSTKLLQDTRKESGQVMITKEVVRFVRLGQQCMDRISAIINQLDGLQKSQTARKASTTQNQKEPPNIIQSTGSNQQGTRSAPCTPTDNTQTIVTADTRARLYSAPVPPLPGSDKSSVYKRPKISPMEMAYKQNQQLMKAYKARLSRMNTKRMVATNLSLTIQRKMAENLAIAKAQEEALEKKMKERQARLEEQAARKFNSPSGMSEEELEQKETYKKVLEYEQDSKWIGELRSKLEENPNDVALVSQLIQDILRCVDHPLTNKLKQYQFRIYEQLYPLVVTKMEKLKQIQVPLPQDLYPCPPPQSSKTDKQNSKQDVGNQSDLVAKVGKLELKVEEESNGDKFDKEQPSLGDNKSSDNSAKVVDGEVNLRKEIDDLESKRSSNYQSNWEEGSDKRADDNYPSISDVEEEEFSSTFRDSDANSLLQDQGEEKPCERPTESEKEGMLEDSDSDQKIHTEQDFKSDLEYKHVIVSDKNLSDSETEINVENDEFNTELGESSSEKNLEDITTEIVQDLELAMKKGDEVTKILKKESKNSQSLIHQISKDYEKYSEENMDDLLDEIMEEDDENDGDLNQSETDTEISQSKVSKDKNGKTSYSQSNDSKDINGKTNLDQSSKSEKILDSSSCEEISSRPQVPKLLELDSKEAKMRNEAYHRHIKGIASDIHNYLDKLITLFIVSYEQLDTPEGRDQLCACLEEPFFKPMWPYLLGLYRLSNEPTEICLAYVMTKKIHSTPGDFGVTKKLTLPDLSTSTHSYPYHTAVHELKNITQQYTLLNKLECLVKSLRLVCQCVEDYYQKDLESGKIHKIPSIGADDLLPIMCYMIVKTELPQIVSECQIMEEFIHEGYIIGEEGYCLTSMQTALGYLLKLDV